MRTALARIAGLVGRPLAFLLQLPVRLSGRHIGVALVYHRIGDPAGDPDRELVPARGTAQFESELRHLKRCYRMVPASHLLEAAAARRRGGRFPVSITFDDDVACHAEVAMPILLRHGIPATFFVGGVSLDAPVALWWESLQQAFDDGLEREAVAIVQGAGSSDIHELGRRIQGMEARERDGVSARLRELAVPDERKALSAAQMRALAAAGFEIGFHTRRHDPLTRLSDEQLAEAMTDGREAVARHAGREVDTISYPHGEADGRVAEAARAAGYRLGFTAARRVARPTDNPFLLGRVGPTIRSSGRGALQIAFALVVPRRGHA